MVFIWYHGCCLTKFRLEILNKNELPPPEVVYESLHLVCSLTNNNDLKVISLDCLAKLFSFSYLEAQEDFKIDPETGLAPPPQLPMIDLAIKTVCDCFSGNNTNPRVELQIVKALMAAVLNEELIAHGSTLLKAIRQTYTIFVVSSSSSNQAIAQATLTQMITAIFDRVKSVFKRSVDTPHTPSTPSLDSGMFSSVSLPTKGEEQSSPSSSTISLPAPPNTKLTLQQMETLSASDERIREEIPATGECDNELFAKDAFLVFRTLCKLSEKPLEYEGQDLRSHGVRSKLLSLHLVHTILKSHMTVFLSNEVVIHSNIKGEETFLVSVKDYICSTLARNAASISPPVFEISAEIFWLIVSNLRSQFKKEIEVFFAEIYFPITEMKTSTPHQKQYFLSIIQKLSNDPRALVEIYLNYDCDSSSAINIYEAIIDFLVRFAVSPVHLTPIQQQLYLEQKHRPIAVYNLSLPPAASISHIASQPYQPENLYPIEHALKMTALGSLTAALRSLLSWSQRRIAAEAKSFSQPSKHPSISENTSDDAVASSPNMSGDDPSQFESLKIKKTALLDAVRQFNSKPKKGIKAFVSSGIIPNDDPATIAEILLNTDGLDKSLIGEYLGEGDPANIAAMHAFVDLMDFTNRPFVDALRRFLQAFRLPGEAQKIDRFMLKFAERYISGNPTVFANADTAYILAYSVILLNTDQHSSQIKNRMSPEDFIKNNRGINDNADLPEELLNEIFFTIQNDEIKLLSEQHAALLSSSGQRSQSGLAGIGQALATVGRDLQREAYLQASREMSNKTEQLFKNLISNTNNKKRSGEATFYVASRVEHVKPMFEVAWMSFLAGLSGPFQQSEDPETIKLCLEGYKYSIRIACLLDVDLARISFVSALARFTNLQSFSEMKQKNVDAIKQLLDTALTEGNFLKTSWRDILTCVSQLERFQLILSGIAAGSIPDVTNARFASNRSSMDSRATRPSATGGILSSFGIRTSSQPSRVSSSSSMYSAQDRQPVYSAELGEELQVREVAIMMDNIFTKSATLSGEAIVDFVRALTEVSWEEIQSSGLSQHPRTFSLQKMVDVSYYNMERIRFEWSQLWAIMGKSFNQVGCHENTSVVFFALDSLRQLSIRFFDLDELSFFKFQKDFLEPFEYIMANNSNIQVKDMVLQCLRQMILSKSANIKSGWRTMFNTFSSAAKQNSRTVVNDTFELVKLIHSDHFAQVISQDSYGNMISCLSEIGKNQRFQKPSLHAIALLKSTIDSVIPLTEASAVPETTLPEDVPAAVNDLYVKFWFPVLFAFHDVIMNGEDLEVRSRALNYLFDTLVEQGSKFSPSFWDTVCQQLLFPIFVVLKSRSEMARFNTQDDMSVWLSTTMIQALRNMVALLSHYFEILSRRLDGFLDLLVNCILQENETVSRIGSSCVLQLVEQNVAKLQPEHWSLIVDRFEQLFEVTTASELFGKSFGPEEDVPVGNDNDLSSSRGNLLLNVARTPNTHTASSSFSFSPESENEDTGLSFKASSTPYTPAHHAPNPSKSAWSDQNHERQKQFRKTIVKCVLQLLMIDAVQEMLERHEINESVPEPSNGATDITTTTTTSADHGEPIKSSILTTPKQPKVHGSEIYNKIPVKDLLRILSLLRHSYTFAQAFNIDRGLRTNLWRQGFMKQLPNLVKQESYSANTYLSVMLRLYSDTAKLYGNGETLEKAFEVVVEEKEFGGDDDGTLVAGSRGNENQDGQKTVLLVTTEDLKSHIDNLLIPMCLEILQRYSELEVTEVRNIKAWTPVATTILNGISTFPSRDFVRLVPTLYPVILSVLNRDMTPELRSALKSALLRIDDYVLKSKGQQQR